MQICGFGAGHCPWNFWNLWKGETFKMPKLLHHWFDRVNMEFAEECMRAMLWHGRDMGYLTPI